MDAGKRKQQSCAELFLPESLRRDLAARPNAFGLLSRDPFPVAAHLPFRQSSFGSRNGSASAALALLGRSADLAVYGDKSSIQVYGKVKREHRQLGPKLSLAHAVLRVLAGAMAAGAHRNGPFIIGLFRHAGGSLAKLRAGHADVRGLDPLLGAADTARMRSHECEEFRIEESRLALSHALFVLRCLLICGDLGDTDRACDQLL